MRPAWSKSETPSIAGSPDACVKIHTRTLSDFTVHSAPAGRVSIGSRRRLTSSPVCSSGRSSTTRYGRRQDKAEHR